MAVISCPECGGVVSDRASKCPHCGNPMAMMPPPVAPQQPTTIIVQNQAPAGGRTVGMDTKELICPYCLGPLSSKDVLSSAWAKCPHCKQDVALNGTTSAFDDNQLIERLARINIDKEAYHGHFMTELMNYGAWDVFDNTKVVSVKHKYFWVREFGRSEERAVYPLSQYGKDTFNRFFNHPYADKSEYSKIMDSDALVRFNNSDLVDAELLPKELSASECAYEFSQTPVGKYDKTSAYFCIPVVEEVVEYNGKQYTFYGLAGGDRATIYNNFPHDPFFKSKPNYTDMSPLTITAIVIVCLVVLIFVISKFCLGFWNGVGCIILMAIIGGFLWWLFALIGGIVLAPLYGIDAIIRRVINKKRQNKFRAKWDQIQAYKKESAARNHGLNFTYTVPEFPF